MAAMNRDWMYRRKINGENGRVLNGEFLRGLESFIDFAISHPECMSGDKIRCPCRKICRNRKFQNVNTLRAHILHDGFKFDYYVWVEHGEHLALANEENHFDGGGAHVPTQYHNMVFNAVGPSFNMDDDMDDVEEAPNPEAQKFYEMLKAADTELWPGCRTHSQLSLVARLMNLKSENNVSEKCFDQFAELMKEIVPENNLVPDNFYKTKKLLRGMGLPVEKIDCCTNNCMLYWKDDSMLNECRICQAPRFQMRSRKKVAIKRMYYFPLTPRLQRLYASNVTAKEMSWHRTTIDDGIMRHPADSPAWKHLNNTFPNFALEPRNVRLGLSTDGFQPFGQTGKQYSSWPVILTPYNLPPWMCMKEQFMFLTVLVPGPQNPKDKLDVFLQPLIDELCYLWDVGVNTYDISQKQNFQMKAVLLWTISDFPAYSMLSGWSTAGRLACPHCGHSTDAFTLQHSGKQSWFDNHRKFLDRDHPFRLNKKAFLKNKTVIKEAEEMRDGEDILNEINSLGLKKVTEENNNAAISKSKGCGWKKKSIFWDLPYWSSLFIRHNLDVMHIEKNVFDNVFNTVLNVKGKTKDTAKSREELDIYCARPELRRNGRTNKYPKACYTLEKNAMNVLFQWVRELKFPDGYVSNLGRCVDMNKLRMFGMKSHDCHVFMQRILPIAFRELLPQHVWKAITELSLFFKDLCCRSIAFEDACRLHDNIPIILCELERIFPPSFFDSMEHLPVHLADEVRTAGPVQYRWMYPFERYLGKLKKMVGNKARVEGSICNAYLVQEASTFCSYYFEEHVSTRYRNIPRNFERGVGNQDQDPNMISIFKEHGRPFGKFRKRYLTDIEYDAIRSYVLLNCAEVEPYIIMFGEMLRASHPTISIEEIDRRMNSDFADWFFTYAYDSLSPFMRDFARGPLRSVDVYPACLVNGYKFHTTTYGSHRATVNSGVCIKGVQGTSDATDYYGRLLEVIEVTYPGAPQKKTCLFKCEWFDGSTVGTQVHPVYKMVSINHKRKYKGDDAFVFATQAIQVFYCSYPSLNRAKADWLAVCKIQARAKVQVPCEEQVVSAISPPLQEDGLDNVTEIVVDEDTRPLVDSNGGLIDIEDANDDTEEEIEYSDNDCSSDDDDDV